MKKYIIMILFISILILFSSCSFLWYEIKKIDNANFSFTWNINKLLNDTWWVNTNSVNILIKDPLDILWEKNEDIINSFYSNDKNVQKIINEWLSDKKNEKTSSKGDIIEFLDYCEKIKNTDNFMQYINKDDETENNEILRKLESLKKWEIDKSNIKEYLNSLIPKKIIKEDDRDLKLYINMYLEIINNSNIKCETIFKKYYE